MLQRWETAFSKFAGNVCERNKSVGQHGLYRGFAIFLLRKKINIFLIETSIFIQDLVTYVSTMQRRSDIFRLFIYFLAEVS